jgi:DHA2 family multidrug resistance protein
MTPLDRIYTDMLEGLSRMLQAQGASAARALEQAQALLYSFMQRQAMMKAFIDNFYLLGILFLAIIPFMFLMKKTGHHKGPMIVE